MWLAGTVAAWLAVTVRGQDRPCKPLAIPNAVYVPAIAGFSSVQPGGRVKVRLCVAQFGREAVKFYLR